jgi:hypothetical protein
MSDLTPFGAVCREYTRLNGPALHQAYATSATDILRLVSVCATMTVPMAWI